MLAYFKIPSLLLLSLLVSNCMSPALKTSNNGEGEPSVDLNTSLSPNSCPETIFPHGDNWSEPQVHGDCVVQIGILDCQQCHGQHLEGQAGPACSNCHHPDNWTEINQHPKRFTDQHPTTSDTTCMTCHGENYEGNPVAVSCNDCHRASHLANWREPQNHGASYCEQRGGDETNFCNLEGSQEANCFNCHSEPITLTNTYAGVTPSTSPPPSCYECHATFPHFDYRQTNRRGETVTFPWRRGHRMMILNNRVLFPGNDLDDPQLVEALRNTCGDGGGCHTNGRFSLPRGNTQAACATVCHQ